MKKKQKKNNNVLDDAVYMIRMIPKKLIVIKFIIIIFECFRLFLSTIYIKVIIDVILEKTLNKVAIIITIIQLISFVISLFLNMVNHRLLERMQYKIRNDLQNVFIKKAINHDLQCYEDYNFYDNYTKAIRQADSKAIDVLNMILGIINSFFSIFLMIGLISSFNWVLSIFIILMIIITIIDTFLSNKCSMELYEAEESINRKSSYLKQIAHHRQYAKEIRIFNMFDFLIEKLNSAFNEKYKLFKKTNSKYWNIKLVFSIINTLIISPAVLIYLAYLVFEGKIGIGDFSMLFNSIFAVAYYISNILNTSSNLNFESKYYISHLRKILDYKPIIENTGTLDLDNHQLYDIEFKDVSFVYPGHEEYILKNVSFKISKGEKIAIVGKNGAGKTTIVKLLLRLYDPTSGEILINNINIKEYKVNQLRKYFSTILQDYNKYAFTISENILLDTKENEDLVNESLKFSGLFDKIQNLKYKEKTYISREFSEDGVDFSGGEYQKLALSRAFAHDSPFIVFDEANSSLDLLAEYELNSKIMNELKEKSAILISHRLSTTVHANLIIMIDGGKVAEIGTHEELLKNNKLYTQMYHKQIEAYKINQELVKYE